MKRSVSRKVMFCGALLAAIGSYALASMASRPAEAKQVTEYDMCMINSYYGCYPLDDSGQPRLPNVGNPDEAAQFEQCVVESSTRCAGLPGDPT